MSCSYDIDHEAEGAKRALNAIIARLNGVFDDPDLVERLPALGDTTDDVLRLAYQAGAPFEIELEVTT